MKKECIKRESNFDLLRLISLVSVIVLHVNATFYKTITDSSIFNGAIQNNVFFLSFLETITRIAVPIFIMLSGAFILADDRNKDYGYFYKKAFKKLGIYTIIFSLIYFGYYIAIQFFQYYGTKTIFWILYEPILEFLKGNPFYHMWYLFMLLGLYVCAPFIIRLKNDIGDSKFYIFSVIFMFFACLSMNTSSHVLSYDIGTQVCYLSYFMLGYSIKHSVITKDKSKGIKNICYSSILMIVLFFGVYYYSKKGVLSHEIPILPLGSFHPVVIIASALLFYGFANLSIDKDFTSISKYSFLMYLIHVGVWDVIQKLLRLFVDPKYINSSVIILVGSIIVFAISYILSYLVDRIYNKILYSK